MGEDTGFARARGATVRALALSLAVSLVLSSAPAARAQGAQETLGGAWLFTNDTFAEGSDRWRTGAIGGSVVRGLSWGGALPDRPFAIVEYRLRVEAITPENLTAPAPGDRLYAGIWWLGAHTHFDWRGLEVTAGADLAVTGEQTGIRSFQSSLHDSLSFAPVGLRDHQVGNAAYLHATVEIARSLRWQRAELRPFAELQVGV